MAKLWEKDYSVNALIEEFTVGSDYLHDQVLVVPDCLASMAHATMLQKLGILTEQELSALKSGLGEIISLAKKGEFAILPSDEDCHTAIENWLVRRVGEAGKKIHTCRSRNDQVITALRLYQRDFMLRYHQGLCDLAGALLALAEREAQTPMPGRTHMQIAMPSSVGLWAASFAEDISDMLRLFRPLFDLVNRNPLGAAASYGVPLPVDRELTARLMGFAAVQNNVLSIHDSRGRTEALLVDFMDHVGIILSKMAQDLILFSLPEFGYFSLPKELCTGSSIMPQKRNPDGLELVRAKSGIISGVAAQIKNVVRSLPSGYNRDFQETKGPFMRAAADSLACVRVMQLTAEKLEVNRANLERGFSTDIYATDAALELVAKGQSFRDAYKQVGTNLDKVANRNPADTIANRTQPGMSGNLNLEPVRALLSDDRAWNDQQDAKVHDALVALSGNTTFPTLRLS